MSKKLFFAVVNDVPTDGCSSEDMMDRQTNFLLRKTPSLGKTPIINRFVLFVNEQDVQQILTLDYFKQNSKQREDSTPSAYNNNGAQRNGKKTRSDKGTKKGDRISVNTQLKIRKNELGLTQAQVAEKIGETGFNVNQVLNDNHHNMQDSTYLRTQKKIEELFEKMETKKK